jgi:hypothetical protein
MTVLRQADLDEAVALGMISAAKAQALAGLAAGKGGRVHGSQERFLIANDVGEIFVAIGLLMLITAAARLLNLAATGPQMALMAGTAALVAWALAEYFVFRRPMMLPGIVATLAFACFAVTAVFRGWNGLALPFDMHRLDVQLPAIGVLALAFWRFRIPFLVLPLAAAIAALVLRGGAEGLLGLRARAGDLWLVLLTAGACGLVYIGAAIGLDMRDPGRLERQSQYAFWLYVAGAPLLVHSLFWSVLVIFALASGRGEAAFLSWGTLGAIVPVALVVTVIGLILDRRALVISTLAYVAYTVGSVLYMAGTGGAGVVVGTLAVLGIYVVLLGVGWRSIRRAVMAHLPLGRLASRLSPVN